MKEAANRGGLWMTAKKAPPPQGPGREEVTQLQREA